MPRTRCNRHVTEATVACQKGEMQNDHDTCNKHSAVKPLGTFRIRFYKNNTTCSKLTENKPLKFNKEVHFLLNAYICY